MPGLAITTISAPAIDSWFNRNDSLTSRLTLFRHAAFPAARTEMASPKRGPLSTGLANTVKRPSADRTGFWKTLSKSFFDRRRRSAPNRVLPPVMF